MKSRHAWWSYLGHFFMGRQIHTFSYYVLHQYPLPNNRVQANNRTAIIMKIWGTIFLEKKAPAAT